MYEGAESSLGQSSSSNRDMDIEAGNNNAYAKSPAKYLHYIAYKCGAKVKFKQALVESIELQFSFELWFAGERIGEGSGRTRREAQQQAAEASLMNLAGSYSLNAVRVDQQEKAAIHLHHHSPSRLIN